jgi:transcriptional regulator with XRE-family HTH domain
MRIRLRADVLTELCQLEGISRSELARQLVVSSTTVYRVERGLVSPSPRFIAELMRWAGMPFDELFEIVAEAAR